jgi:hypothetical protein
MSPKESKAAILKVKFSFKGDYLAISYDNENKGPESLTTKLMGASSAASKANAADKKESSFVLLFVNRESSRNPGIKLTSKDPYVRM